MELKVRTLLLTILKNYLNLLKKPFCQAITKTSVSRIPEKNGGILESNKTNPMKTNT